MQENKKILLIVNYIPNYRLPVYNLIGKQFKLTIATFSDNVLISKNINFTQIHLTPVHFCGFIFFKEKISSLAKQFDIVISLSDIRLMDCILLGFRQRNFGLIYWGIGVGASYTKKFDGDGFFLNKLRMYLCNRADALIFYSDYPRFKYINFGSSKEKLFVAHNTVQIEDIIELNEYKKYFIFVGTLYKQKNIYELLNAYLLYIKKSINILPLVIVGDGPEIRKIKDWITDNFLEEFVLLKGSVYEQKELKILYQDAIACISPGQAGLTVLNSIAYGVPFVTSKNAITGGEIFNVIHNETGIIYDGTVESLSEVMKKLSEDTSFTKFLSENSQKFYFENRQVKTMIDGFVDAIEYVYKNINANN
jgi:glycosyltransferase involved in cell wall biosynthesis